MKRIGIAALTIALLATLMGAGSDTIFAEGQRWSYKTRAGEESSMLVIGRLEQHPDLGSIAHISIFKVNFRTSRPATAGSTDLAHIPISESALRKSVRELVGSGSPDPNFDEGYRIWSEAVRNEQAGAFTLTVSEVVSHVEQTVTSR